MPQNNPVAGLTFAPNGTLYAAIDDKLCTLNTTTGAAIVVDAATPDFSFSSVSGLAFAQGASVLANLSSRPQVIGGGDDVLISGFIAARSILMETPTLYVKRGCPYCKAAKDYLDQHQIAYREVEVRSDLSQMKKLEEVLGQSKTPTLDWNGEVLSNFGTEEPEKFLAERSP